MAADLEQYKIFFSSSPGMPEERRTFREVLTRVNETKARKQRIEFVAMGLDRVPGADDPSVTAKDLQQCQFFLLLLWNRWGTAENDYKIARSQSALEFSCFFRALDEALLAAPSPEIRKVLDFKIQMEREYFPDTFDTLQQLERLMEQQLERWLHAVTTGPLHLGARRRPPPKNLLAEWSDPAPGIDPNDFQAVVNAIQLANEGRITESEEILAREISKGNDAAYNQYGLLLMNLGRLAQAQTIFERVLNKELSQEDRLPAYGNLGNILFIQQDYGGAEAIYRRVLETSIQLGQYDDAAASCVNLGSVISRQGRRTDAVEMFRKAIQIAEPHNYIEILSAAYEAIGEEFEADQNFKSAENAYENALAYRRKLDVPTATANLLKKLAKLYHQQNALENADRAYGEAFSLLSSVNMPLAARTEVNWGTVLGAQGNLEAAEEHFQHALAVFQTVHDHDGSAKAYGNLGNVYRMQGRLDEAEDALLRAIKSESHYDRPEMLSSFYTALGSLFGIRGKLSDARAAQQKALELDKDAGNEFALSVSYGNIGATLAMQGDVSSAEEYLRKAIELNTRLEARSSLPKNNYYLGVALQRQGRLSEAQEAFEAAIAVDRSVGRSENTSVYMVGLGDLLTELDQPEKAEEYYQEAILIDKTALDQRGVARILARLGRLMLATSRQDEARGIFLEGLDVARSVGEYNIIANCGIALGLLAINGGDQTGAVKYLREAEDASRRLGDIESLGIIHNIYQELNLPLRVRGISLHNFKNIKDLDLDLERESSLPGRWVCLAGINGAGKSAILQAIVLGLLGDTQANDLESRRLQEMCRRDGGISSSALVTLRLQDDTQGYEVVLRLDERGIDHDSLRSKEIYPIMRALWSRRGSQLLVAYGASRNLSDTPETRSQQKNDEVRRVITLFDPLAQLLHTEALITKSPEAAAVLQLLRPLLGEVLRDVAIKVDEGNEQLRFIVNGATVTAAELPDGFRSTIGWLGDLCMNWLQKAPDGVSKTDHREITGIVLIDEIDLHLHPQLQRTLVPRLREALPNVQWIVSTHSPLVLSCFDRNELIVLDADSPTGVRELDRQIIGFTTNEVYEWLMQTRSRSGAIDDQFLAALQGDEEKKRQTALLLSQSPTMSEASASQAMDFRKTFGRKRKESKEEELP